MARRERGWLKPFRPTQADAYRPGVQASAAVSGAPGKDEATARWGLTRQQQLRAWSYRREVPEFAYGIGFYEACFSRLRLSLAVEEDDGRRRPVFDEDGKPLVEGAAQALGLLRELRSPIGGQTQLLRSFGGNLAAVGECHLVGVDAANGKRSFNVYSPSEFYLPSTVSTAAVTKTSTGKAVNVYHQIVAPGQNPKNVRDDEALVVRVWQPDTEYSLLPWAPALSMLEVLEEMVLLTREVAASVRSRLAMAGILLIADDIDFPEREDAENDSEELHPFVADLIRHASTAIKDKSSVAGFTPLVAVVPYDRVKDGMHLIEFGRKWDEEAAKKREECFVRMARGFDLPYEILAGHQHTTFTNAAQISDDLYRTHVEPKAAIMTDAITVGYLQTSMPGTSIIIDHDPTDLVVHPDQIGDWERAFDRKVVSFASYRNKLGASEGDAPDDDELVLRLLLDIAQHARVAPGGRVIDVAPTADELRQGVGTADTPQDEPVDEAAGVAAALEVEVRRVMDRAGARLRSKVSGKPGLASLLQNVANRDVAMTLGPDMVRSLMTDAELLGREFDVLHGYVQERMGVALADRVKAKALNKARERMYSTNGSGTFHH